MNKEILKNNLIKTIDKINPQIDVYSDNVKFKILVLLEETKKHSSTDDWMYLCVFKDNRIGQSLIDINNVVNILMTDRAEIPVFINVELYEFNKENIIFKLEVSMRFRKVKGLNEKNYDFIPFKIKS